MTYHGLTISDACLTDFCRRHHIRKLALFGSILRSDFGPESDVDVLVEFEPGHPVGLIGLAGMELELSELMGRKVDLNTKGFLSPSFREQVLREAQCNMSHRDDATRLRHMLDHAREAVVLTADKTRTDLQNTRLLQLGLVRLIEIIGEAAARVSEAGRASHSAIPWPAIVGMRNRLIHGYDAVDLDVLWDTVRNDLPLLIAELEKPISGPLGPTA